MGEYYKQPKQIMGRVAKVQRKLIESGHKIHMVPAWISPSSNELQIRGEIYSLSETKAYLLRHCEDLTSKYRLRVLYDSKGKARILYVWENIIAEAVEKGILPFDSTNQEQEYSTRSIHFILTGKDS